MPGLARNGDPCLNADTLSSALFQDPTQPLTIRVQDLLSHLTLSEKIGQLMYAAPAIERLGIPQYNWWNEALHGLGRAGKATVFPQAIGLAATWNPDLLHQVAAATADEARAKHNQAVKQGLRQIYTGLTFWSPNINIFRDPRWGRGQETYGEDPCLTAQLGVAFVTGLQGGDPHYLKLAATPKHYAVHSGPEPSRHTFNAQVESAELHDFYLFAFEACVVQGRAASIMGAYNRVNDEACCASPTLLESILRREWGFDGYVVSDCGAIHDVYAHHHLAQTPAGAAALAVLGGCDLECGAVYGDLPQAMEQGLLSEADIDRSLGRLLAARFRLGMFDPPEQVPFSTLAYQTIDSAEHQQLALEAARESIVLLKNENNFLPLSKDLRSIAVIGPNANDPLVMLGNYNGTPAAPITPLQGIQQKVGPDTQVYYALGCPLVEGLPPFEVVPAACLRPDAVSQAAGLIGDYYSGSAFQGQPVRHQLDAQIDFLWLDSGPLTGQWAEAFSIRWRGYLVPPVSGRYKLGVNGYSGYRLLLEDNLLVEGSFVDNAVRRAAEVTLEAGRPYAICLEVWNDGLNPEARLVWAPPQIDYQAKALELAQKSEVVVMVMGLSNALEGEENPDYEKVPGFQGGDRTDLQLPQTQTRLLEQVYALGKPIVLVLLNGSALAVNWANDHVSAILEAWYPGQAGGTALADVLFGDYNPGGKLPVTFYKSVDDLPPFDDYHLAGHTYRYFTGQPLYPFGFGLSFTNFALDHLQLDHQKLGPDESCQAQVQITNTGSRVGAEVVQLYASFPQSAAPRPIRQLIGFCRVQLAPAETKTVTFTLHASQFGSHNAHSQFVLEPGLINLSMGTSSADLPLSSQLEITGPGAGSLGPRVFFSQTTVNTTRNL